jgi:hypothetical protein
MAERACRQCGETKALEQFGFRCATEGRRHRRCKLCVAAYGKRHYAAHRAEYVAASARNTRRRQDALKRKVWDYLAKHPCVDCGESDSVVLEFDHVNPAEKRAEIYWLVHRTFSWSTIAAEIQRCEVRCANCHRRRTAGQFGWHRGRWPDGPAEAPARRRARLKTPTRVSVPARQAPVAPQEGQRLCGLCEVAKPVKAFHFRDKARGTRSSICAECFTAYRQAHYRLNREHYIRRNGLVLRQRKLRWSRHILEYLSQCACVDCGEHDPVVLEFDHLDPATKLREVSFFARAGYPWSTVARELAKCQVRCANCHRRRTATQFAWPKLQHAKSEVEAKRVDLAGLEPAT